MAALGKIRSKGLILACIIGLGLFAFIAEEGFRSCETTRNNQRQQIGEVLGKKISFQDFQKMVDEYSEVIKMQQGTESLSEDVLNNVKDYVWNQYVSNQIVAKQAEELGLTVTDAEMQNILSAGTNPMLAQTPFVNQQTGRFDANQLKTFLNEYEAAKKTNSPQAQQFEAIYKYWIFTEKTMRSMLLAQKFQQLLQGCMLTNKIETKRSFEESSSESSIELAAFPYSSVEDAKITVSDADLKAKYNELKELFIQPVETRDIKYVDYTVTASASDRTALQKNFSDYAADLATTSDPTDLVRKSSSTVPFTGIPCTKAAFPYDIAQMIDSTGVGMVSKVKENKSDNTLNVVKVIAKQQMPDSVEVQTIFIADSDPDKAATRADSVLNAINAGSVFDSVAVKLGQNGTKQWIASKDYQMATTVDKDNKAYFLAINQMGTGELRKLDLTQGHLIVKLCDRRALVDKYTVAVIKRTIDFSKETYREAYNKFSSFVSSTSTADDLNKNAQKAGYTVRDGNSLTTSLHNVMGIRNTREALKWIFEGKEGEFSPMYECGDNNHLLVLMLNKVSKKGYLTLDNDRVKEYIKGEVLKDKKAEQLIATAKELKDINSAKAKGAKLDTIAQVTFSAPAYIQATASSEPAISGAVAATAKGAFSKYPIKGNAGVYLFKVNDRKAGTAKYDEKEQARRVRQSRMASLRNVMYELQLAANVVDNRYLFF